MEFETDAYLQLETTNLFPDRKLRSFYEQVVHHDRLWIRIENASQNELFTDVNSFIYLPIAYSFSSTTPTPAPLRLFPISAIFVHVFVSGL